MSLYFVQLRRPRNLEDRRDDPFWEFGSFGSTGCHSRNLMNPVRGPLKDGDKLAFIQGGDGELRIIAVTPPIQVYGDHNGIEALWDKEFRPRSFAGAPLLIDNQDRTDFPSVHRVLKLAATERTTPCGKVSSRLRSRTAPVPAELACEIEALFQHTGTPMAASYLDAVAPAGSRWHSYGVRAEWNELRNRKRFYRELSAPPPRKRAAGKRRC